MTIRLHKLHATGNDFLVHSLVDGGPPLSAAQAAALCDRHTGVGADGLIILSPGYDGADCTMTLHNADGGIAEMSGNGSRCLAWVAARAGLGTDTELVVDTGGGRRTMRLERAPHGDVIGAETDMGPVTFDPAEIPVTADSPFGLTATFHGTEYEGDAAGVGNPHWVLFVDDPATARVTQHGPRLERDERFPKHANVEFVRVDDRGHLTMRVWERGVGETRSCGTGACATAAVARRRGLVDEVVEVRVLGGDLRVTVGDTVRLAGPVVHVFDVELDPDRLG